MTAARRRRRRPAGGAGALAAILGLPRGRALSLVARLEAGGSAEAGGMVVTLLSEEGGRRLLSVSRRGGCGMVARLEI